MADPAAAPDAGLAQACPERSEGMALVAEMNQTVRTLALAGLRQRYPNDTPAQRRRRLADLLLGPELAAKVYGPLSEAEAS